MEADIVRFLNEFHVSVMLPRAITSSFIALAPKNESPQSLVEYHPISLIGSLYRILSKLLAGRLKKVLGGVITCGVVVVNELVDWANRNK